MDLVNVASFPKYTYMSPLLVHLSENGIQYNIETTETTQILQVPQSDAERVTRFLQNTAEGLGDDVRLGVSSTPLAKMFKVWPVTCGAIVLGIFGFLLTEFDPNVTVVRWFSYLQYETVGRMTFAHSFFESVIASGQWWRMITPAFLHFGPMHILFNALGMWELGRRLELFLGWRTYLFFLIAIIQVSNFAQYSTSGSGLFGGLSGAVFGFVGLIAVLSWRTKSPILQLPKALYVVVGVSALLGITGLMTKIFGIHIANAAHVAGLICGAVLGILLPMKKVKNEHSE